MKTLTISVTMLLVLCVSNARVSADSPADTARASLENYFKAWNEPDQAKRATLLAKTWAENGTYTDPTAHADGRDGLVKHIQGVMMQMKGFSITRTSEIEFHHDVFRFDWVMKDASGATITTGVDYGAFNESGAITKIVGFFGPVPTLK